MATIKTSIFFLFFLCLVDAHSAEPQISAGRYHNLGLASDGTVYWWGNDQGTRNFIRIPIEPKSPMRVDGLPRIQSVAAGWQHSVAIAEDGSVYEWGFSPYNEYQVLMRQPLLGVCELERLLSGGHGKNPCAEEEIARATKIYVAKPIRIAGIPPAAIVAALDDTTIIVSRDGNVYCWSGVSAPQQIIGLEKIKAIGLGQFHGVALRDDGAVLTWGHENNGKLGHSSAPDESICFNPKPQVAFTQAAGIGAGVESTYAYRADGTVWGWGDPWSEQLGFKTTARKKTDPTTSAPRHIATVNEIVQLATGGSTVIARTAEGKLISWGVHYESVRDLPMGLRKNVMSLVTPQMSQIKALSTYDHTLTLTQDGFVCAWGGNTYGETRPDNKRRSIQGAVPVLLADGQTPLNLFNDKNALPTQLCGDEHWRGRIALWEADELEIKRSENREQALAAKVGFVTPNWFGRSAVISAVALHNRKALESLLATGECDLNIQDANGLTALHNALLKESDSGLATLLLDRGANPKLISVTGLSTLMLAAENQGPILFKRLISLGVPVDAKNADGSTALMYAVAGKNVENVRLLIAQGADVNSQNMSGDTALSIAQYEDQIEIVHLLQKAGAVE
ncbi:ankyrin repeat domain-containing protein [Solimicrobium silvestre]|uniref:Ankyrin repeats (3 copies) n=1 Tax=Solimicrobium silvestre TaxID=2099400 RepID=A0A2S9H2Y2_9BURK|nr:ankyrin repeat domain-containing protein [Solimicrobium silvestre]PRC94317.1 Ankyrin repeats (3 copies) [Solimicrobium silvestre]